ncbi:hypothetical protein Goshw_003721, partial [Gossypium schwendimanii]|nr:hypothetical protein [Gossypium schwendimanii]
MGVRLKQPELLLIKHTPVSKVVLAWDFYRYTGPIHRYKKDFYRYKFPSTDTTKLQTTFNANFYSCNDSILFLTATNVHNVFRGLKY